MAKREVTSVRIPDEQLVEIRGAALIEGKTLSTFIREAALKRAREPRDAFVSDDQQVNAVQAKVVIPNRRSEDA